MPTDPDEIRLALYDHAMTYPGATEEFPWGERVIKVKGKIFAFLGRAEERERVGITVKLPQSAMEVLTLPGAKPTGYGLGKSGWVTVHFAPGDTVDVAEVCRWIDESYRAVAPKKLIASLGK